MTAKPDHERMRVYRSNKKSASYTMKKSISFNGEMISELKDSGKLPPNFDDCSGVEKDNMLLELLQKALFSNNTSRARALNAYQRPLNA